MSQPKPLLRVDGETFLQRAVTRLRGAGCRTVTVVIAAAHESVRDLANALDTVVVANPAADSEQIDSLRLALASLPADSAAALVLPVDFPLIQPDTFAAVISAHRVRWTPVAVPSYEGHRGHPVLLAHTIFGEILSGRLPHGLRSLLDRYTDETARVEVTDSGVITDIDTPQDFARLIERHHRDSANHTE